MATLQHALEHTDRDLPAWCHPDLEGEAARQAAVAIYRELFHRDTSLGNATSHLPGILATRWASVEAARAVNRAKDGFLAALKAIPHQQQPERLGRLKLARIHRKQVRRHIKILDPAPASIGWGWTRKVAQYKPVDRAALEPELAARAELSQSAREDLACLRSLPAEVKLIRLKPGAIYVVANANYPPVDGSRRRRTLFTPMPILSQGERIPLYRPLKHQPNERRAQLRRKDARVEEKPVLPSLNVYRMKPE
jgi:hypothetical protein